jgi:hypothetical protein
MTLVGMCRGSLARLAIRRTVVARRTVKDDTLSSLASYAQSVRYRGAVFSSTSRGASTTALNGSFGIDALVANAAFLDC